MIKYLNCKCYFTATLILWLRRICSSVYLGKSFIVWLFVGFKITFYPFSRKRTTRIRHSNRWLCLWHFLMTHFVFVKLFKPQRPIFLWSVLKKLVLSLANKIVGKSLKTKLQKDSFSLSFFLLCQADMTQSSHRFQIAAFVRLKKCFHFWMSRLYTNGTSNEAFAFFADQIKLFANHCTLLQ